MSPPSRCLRPLQKLDTPPTRSDHFFPGQLQLGHPDWDGGRGGRKGGALRWFRGHVSKLGKRAPQFPRRREWCPKTTQLPLPCGSPIPAPMVTFPGGCSLRVSSGFSGADFQVPAPAPMAEAVTAGPPPATCCFSVSAGGGGREVPGWAVFRGYPFAAPQ